MSEATLEPRLRELCAAVPAADGRAAAAARARLDRLTKPQGSLGQLEDLLARMAGSTGRECPSVERPAILLAAADHGVAAEGVSAYPQAVTAQMVRNYLAGGAAINALAAAAGARLLVVDAGVAGGLPGDLPVRRLGIRAGSGNIAHEPAMGRAEAAAALLAGAALAAELIDAGADILALGEMGIANTTPAAALTSAFTGAPPAQTVGRGTGVDDATLAHKLAVVERALARARAAGPAGALATLAELGGLEIAALAGATLAAAARRVPVLLDGYITTAAALAAAAFAPAVRDHLLASHCSAEPGHALALAHLGLSEAAGAGPLLRLGLRLGEGSGAALALPLVAAAARLMREMATFDQAGVSEKDAG
jgi:nicotinate-nucleotide--dimethylbenzimidazole phosphoribosyltransferase